MSSTTVHVKEAVLVVPSDPTPNHVLRLSALDSQLFLRFTFEYLLLYHPRTSPSPSPSPSPALDRTVLTHNLKSGLGRALVPFYPLAGRIRKRPDASGLEVVCRAQGAVFIEAVSGSTVSEFGSIPRRGGTQWRKLLSLCVDDVLKGAPPVVVQLTWLSDGGAALAVGFNHCLCDGIGSGEFLNAFADFATGRRAAKPSPSPIWSRYLLDPPLMKIERCKPLPSHPEFRSVPDLCGFASRYTRERMIPTSIVYSESKIKELKKLIKSPCTSFEVLSAHVWRSWAKSLCLPANQTVKLLFSVNIRERVNPSLPSGYYGNAFVLGCAQALAGDLGERGLEYAREAVKRAKDGVGDEYVREVVESVSGRGGASVDSVGVLIMSQWTRLGLERVDFGIGKPANVWPLCCDRYCILLPVPEQRGAVKVALAVPETAVDRYLYCLKNPSSVY